MRRAATTVAFMGKRSATSVLLLVSEILEINGYEPGADVFDYGAVFLSERDQA